MQIQIDGYKTKVNNMYKIDINFWILVNSEEDGAWLFIPCMSTNGMCTWFYFSVTMSGW